MEPFPCPICDGSGKRFDDDILHYGEFPCTCCHGEKVIKTEVMKRTPHTGLKPSPFPVVNSKRTKWTPEEDAILHKPGLSRLEIVKLIFEATGKSRSVESVTDRKIFLNLTPKKRKKDIA